MVVTKNPPVTPKTAQVIEHVQYLDDLRTFEVQLDTGPTYMLKLDSLAESDSSGVERYRIGRGRHHFKVIQRSENTLEVPWDVVLYHCEPGYEYHKTKEVPNGETDRASRIGRRLRELRLGQGYSVAALATAAGLQRPNLSRLEHGRHVPSLETLERLAEALQVPVAQLVSVEAPPGRE
ncbi:MAG: Transcriptional regulator, contains XRE-family HTH domain [Chloroflexi bacterium]|jgi:DNA-binding XRE family transcriptional regulator|nr:MAG: Transcriptional regulator, contains XRE-family HTH domain [Chloroflexota bacterium]